MLLINNERSSRRTLASEQRRVICEEERGGIDGMSAGDRGRWGGSSLVSICRESEVAVDQPIRVAHTSTSSTCDAALPERTGAYKPTGVTTIAVSAVGEAVDTNLPYLEGRAISPSSSRVVSSSGAMLSKR